MIAATCSCENGSYLAIAIDGSVITCDEIIDVGCKSYDEETKFLSTNFNNKLVIYKAKNLYILHAFLSITCALLIAVNIYCYPIEYKAKQKGLLTYYVTIDKLKRVLYYNSL